MSTKKKTKLALIADTEESFVTYMIDELRNYWGNSENTVYLKDIRHAQGDDLFSQTPLTVVYVNNKQDIEVTLKTLESPVSNYYPCGLIIATTMNKNMLRRLTKAIEGQDGRIYVAEKKKLDTTKSFVHKISLSQETKEYLIDFASENYPLVIPIIEALRELSVEKQRKITPEMLSMRMPLQKGVKPVWELETALLAGDIHEFFRIAQRTPQTQGVPLMASSYLLRTFRMWLLCSQVTNKQQAQKMTGLTGYPLTKTWNNSKKFNTQQLMEAVRIMVECDHMLKGGSRAPGNITFETHIMKCFIALGL